MSAAELPLDQHDRCPSCGSAVSVVVVEQPSLMDGPTLRTCLQSCACGWSGSEGPALRGPQ